MKPGDKVVRRNDGSYRLAEPGETPDAEVLAVSEESELIADIVIPTSPVFGRIVSVTRGGIATVKLTDSRDIANQIERGVEPTNHHG